MKTGFFPESKKTLRPPGQSGDLSKTASNRKKQRAFAHCLIPYRYQMARSTLLERRHLVQTYTWRGVPSTIALTRLTLGFHILLERLWEWETLIPKATPLPQISHLAISCTSNPSLRFRIIAYVLRIGLYDSRYGGKKQEEISFFSKFFVGIERRDNIWYNR